jgi:hypothetical protein
LIPPAGTGPLWLRLALALAVVTVALAFLGRLVVHAVTDFLWRRAEARLDRAVERLKRDPSPSQAEIYAMLARLDRHLDRMKRRRS